MSATNQVDKNPGQRERRSKLRLTEHSSCQRNPEKMNAQLVVIQTRYGCGIEDIDRHMGGGILPNELVHICGESGTGKTRLMMSFVRQAALNRQKVYYLITETKMQPGPFQLICSDYGRVPMDTVRVVHLQDCNQDAYQLGSLISSWFDDDHYLLLIDCLSTPMMLDSLISPSPVSASSRLLQSAVALLRKKDVAIVFSTGFSPEYKFEMGLDPKLFSDIATINISLEYYDNQVESPNRWVSVEGCYRFPLECWLLKCNSVGFDSEVLLDSDEITSGIQRLMLLNSVSI